jgi:hypothetical protein
MLVIWLNELLLLGAYCCGRFRRPTYRARTSKFRDCLELLCRMQGDISLSRICAVSAHQKIVEIQVRAYQGSVLHGKGACHPLLIQSCTDMAVSSEYLTESYFAVYTLLIGTSTTIL